MGQCSFSLTIRAVALGSSAPLALPGPIVMMQFICLPHQAPEIFVLVLQQSQEIIIVLVPL